MIIKSRLTAQSSNVNPKVKGPSKDSPQTVVEPKYKIVEEKPIVEERPIIVEEEDLLLVDPIEED